MDYYIFQFLKNRLVVHIGPFCFITFIDGVQPKSNAHLYYVRLSYLQLALLIFHRES